MLWCNFMEQFSNMEFWIDDFKKNLLHSFGDRIICLGLQGSYGRGEQTSTSDIDVVVILDRVSFSDLQTYRNILDTNGCREILCGFVAGKEELLAWEKYDLLQLYLDTKPYVGSLDFLKDVFTGENIRQAVRVGVCNIYHVASHNFLHARNMAVLKDVYKSARFVIRMKNFYETGSYVSSMRELFNVAGNTDKEILEECNGFSTEYSEEEFNEKSQDIIEWASNLTKRMG